MSYQPRSTDTPLTPTPNTQVTEITCPHCGHKLGLGLWHKVQKAAGEVLDGVGNAIGEAKFGG